MNETLQKATQLLQNGERIDGDGLRFICSSFSNYQHATFRVVRCNGAEWEIPINNTKELICIGGNKDWIFALLELFYTKDSTIYIDCRDNMGNKRIYSTDFSCVKQESLSSLNTCSRLKQLRIYP